MAFFKRGADGLPSDCGGRRHQLRTERLLLRTPTLPEWRAAVAAASDPDAQRWLGWPAANLIPAAERDALLELDADEAAGERLPMRHGGLVALDPEARTVVGAALFDAGLHGPEGGGWLAPKYRGRGLGTELFTGLLEYGHRHLGYRKVRAGAEVTNLASLGALRAAGFVPAWGMRKHVLPDKRTVEAHWFEHVVTRQRRCRA